ncbi:MAG: hypothetical protein IKZ07_00580 [Akkermansia sp.]|nr:hypothetical protein [Akkermansia sp.]
MSISKSSLDAAISTVTDYIYQRYEYQASRFSPAELHGAVGLYIEEVEAAWTNDDDLWEIAGNFASDGYLSPRKLDELQGIFY